VQTSASVISSGTNMLQISGCGCIGFSPSLFHSGRSCDMSRRQSFDSCLFPSQASTRFRVTVADA
jgi:hypothetical protein